MPPSDTMEFRVEAVVCTGLVAALDFSVDEAEGGFSRCCCNPWWAFFWDCPFCCGCGPVR